MAVSRANWSGHTRPRRDVGLRLGFRSGLEAQIAKQIEAAEGRVTFESLKIPYIIPEAKHTYSPDFVLRNGIIIESKGKFETHDRLKHVLILNQYGGRLDIRFVFQRHTDPIRKGSPTSYSMWASKMGFKWAARNVPPSWFSEPGPAEKPHAVLGRPAPEEE